jgi:hypothetical protein
MRHTSKMSFRTHPLQQSPTYDDRPSVSSKTRFVCLMPCVRASAQLGLVLAKQTISQLSTVLSKRTRQTLEKRPFCLNFSYVCPTPVLAKSSFIYINCSKKAFFGYRSHPARTSSSRPSRPVVTHARPHRRTHAAQIDERTSG